MLMILCVTEEMKMFTRANKEEHFTFCWTLFIILLLLNNIVGLTLAMTVGWEVGLGVGLGLFPVNYASLGKYQQRKSATKFVECYFLLKINI